MGLIKDNSLGKAGRRKVNAFPHGQYHNYHMLDKKCRSGGAIQWAVAVAVNTRGKERTTNG